MRNFKQKRKSAIILILAVCVTLIVILCVILTNMIGNIIKKRSEYIVTAELINISDNGYNPANDRQYDASARLFVWNDTLYFFMTPDNKKAQFRGELCAFKNNTVVSYGKMVSVNPNSGLR